MPSLTGCGVTYAPNPMLPYNLADMTLQWQRHHPSNFDAFSGMPLSPHNMSDSRYDINAHVDHRMPFDVQSVPVTPRSVFATEAWPLCYRYADKE